MARLLVKSGFCRALWHCPYVTINPLDLLDGSRFAIRQEGKSGHPKVEITDAYRNSHEKVTIVNSVKK